MEPLPTAAFGDTGLSVTRLGFGTALAGPDRPHWTDETADRQLNQVLDAGINFIDTAYDYAESERRIGASLGSRYGEFILATKCGCTDTLPGLNASTHEWTRENLFRGLEISLRRLNRDSVDVMQLHNPGVAECEAGAWSTPCRRCAATARCASSASPPCCRTCPPTWSGECST